MRTYPLLKRLFSVSPSTHCLVYLFFLAIFCQERREILNSLSHVALQINQGVKKSNKKPCPLNFVCVSVHGRETQILLSPQFRRWRSPRNGHNPTLGQSHDGRDERIAAHNLRVENRHSDAMIVKIMKAVSYAQTRKAQTSDGPI